VNFSQSITLEKSDGISPKQNSAPVQPPTFLNREKRPRRRPIFDDGPPLSTPTCPSLHWCPPPRASHREVHPCHSKFPTDFIPNVIFDRETLIREYYSGKTELIHILHYIQETPEGIKQSPFLTPVSIPDDESFHSLPEKNVITAREFQGFVADDDALANAVMAKLPVVAIPIRKCGSARKPQEEPQRSRGSSRTPRRAAVNESLPLDDCLMTRAASSRRVRIND
jgi:hypothetical protein